MAAWHPGTGWARKGAERAPEATANKRCLCSLSVQLPFPVATMVLAKVVSAKKRLKTPAVEGGVLLELQK